jgi:hypothetical protein
MAFEEAVKNLVISLIGASGIFAYIGFQIKDQHVPLRLFMLSLSSLMLPISAAIGLRSLEEQAGASPSTAQAAIISMAEVAYWVLLTAFIVVMGYFIIVFIKWIFKTMINYSNEKDRMEKVITD